MIALYDILSARCPHCRALPGTVCVTRDGTPARKPHKARARDALALAAHTDPALDALAGLGPVSQCGLCGTPGLPQRHRIVDAIAGRLEAGEGEDDVAADYRLFPEVIEALKDWMLKWPGAWG